MFKVIIELFFENFNLKLGTCFSQRTSVRSIYREKIELIFLSKSHYPKKQASLCPERRKHKRRNEWGTDYVNDWKFGKKKTTIIEANRGTLWPAYRSTVIKNHKIEIKKVWASTPAFPIISAVAPLIKCLIDQLIE